MAKGLRIGYPDNSVRRISCDTGLYTIQGSESYRDYHIVAESASFSLTGQDALFSASDNLIWPNHSPGYIPVLPLHGGYGMDTPGGTGRHLGTPATSIILIDSLAASNTGSARPELGTNVYSGTFEYAWRHSASPKVIIPIISGWVNTGANIPMQTGTPPRPGYISYWGQFAPAAGFWLRGTRPHLNGADNCVVMHMRSYIGDDAAGLGADNRDPFGSGYGTGLTSSIVLINNEFGFSVDELIDFFRPHTLVTWAYNAFVFPLHDSIIDHPGDPTNTDHGFGPTNGGDASGIHTGSFACYRNLFAHGTGRNPATTAQQLAYANNLHYNHGRPGGGKGEALDIWSQNTTMPMLANVLGNGFVRGPENNDTLVAVRVRSGAPAGTQGYLASNAAFGWTAANQFSFVSSGVGTWQQTSLQSGAQPGSWGSEAAGYLNWASGTNPSNSEWHQYIDLVDSGVGAQPSIRISDTPVDRALDQIRARIDGGSTSAQFINTTQDYTGNGNIADPYWSVSTTTIDPTNPGSAWYAPLPTGAGRDTPYTTGTFSNGLSRVGRSPLEVWAIEEHWRRGGK